MCTANLFIADNTLQLSDTKLTSTLTNDLVNVST